MLILVGCVGLHWPVTAQRIYREYFWEERDKWQRAADYLHYLGAKAGAHIADIGCHEGYMTVKLSTAVGKNGKVYAVDIEDEKLSTLRENLRKRSITNVQVIKGDYDDPKLPANQLDAVLILDTYHEMDSYQKILAHIEKALKPGGILVISESISDSRRNQTRSQQHERHEIGMNFVLKDLEQTNFSVIHQEDPFVDREAEEGDKLWIIVCKK